MPMLSQAELAVLKPLYSVTQNSDKHVHMELVSPLKSGGERKVRLELSGVTLLLRLDMPDQAPVFEMYTSIQGVALAYSCAIAKLAP